VFVDATQGAGATAGAVDQHFTIIVNSTTLVGDVVTQTMQKMLHKDPAKEYLLYEEGSSGGACFLKELQNQTPLSQVTSSWEETRAELPESDMRFRLVLKEKQGQVRDFARRKNQRYNHRKTMVGGAATRAIRDPYYKAPQMSKREKLYSVVGTPSYMAREILEGEGYEAVVDWWSIGCIMYEMLVGELPFSGSTPEELFQAVLNSDEALNFPESLSEDARDIVRRFLTPPKERLGYNGVQEIHSHPFFASIDWANLPSVTPPFVPEVDGEYDLSYFDKAQSTGIPAQLDEPLPTDNVTGLVYDPFAKSEWNFSIRN
jgi:serine/threonine protein kinase